MSVSVKDNKPFYSLRKVKNKVINIFLESAANRLDSKFHPKSYLCGLGINCFTVPHCIPLSSSVVVAAILNLAFIIPVMSLYLY